MSTTEGRRERMERILKCLRVSQRPLTPNEIALRTEVLTEITMDRLYKYLAELEWAGMIFKHGNTYKVLPSPSMKIKRERKNKRKNKRKKGG